jgi:hypothetical protein
MSLVSSTIIEHIKALCEDGQASMGYFYFDFRNVSKQGLHDLLPSLLTQLSARSTPRCDILSKLYSDHDDGKMPPSNTVLTKCLEDMHAHTPRSTSHLPYHGCFRRVSDNVWDPISLRKGASTSEGPRRPRPSKTPYLCHEPPRNRHTKCHRASDLSPGVPSRSNWTKGRYRRLCSRIRIQT